MTTVEKIQFQIQNNLILLYMKGTPKIPSCGFSAQVVKILSVCGERFAYVDILQHPDIRVELPKYANWPTFPQLWVNGELVGGCDILTEMHQKGELKELLQFQYQEKLSPITEDLEIKNLNKTAKNAVVMVANHLSASND